MFLRKNLFSRLSKFRLLFIGLAAVVGVQPIAQAATLSKDQQRQYTRFVEQLLQQSTGEQAKITFADAAVGQLPCMQDKGSLIGSNEWQELQVDSLIKAIDKTETSFGRVVLRQSMHPTTDMNLIDMRRNQVKTLLEDQQLFSTVGRELQRIKKAEDAILAYWDESQLENQGALFHRSKDFYESNLVTTFGQRANYGKWSLEASSAWKF